MDLYKLTIPYRDYKVWDFEPSLEISKSPLEFKLFHGDSVIKNEDGNISMKTSIVRKAVNIPAILLLENNRTYGRTANKKRLYYKCRPHDTKLPHFLIPFDMPMGFNKNFKNKYITFYFDHWNEKHPHGILSQNLGDVYHYPSFCEYILYCKNLHHSITSSIAKAKVAMKSQLLDNYIDTLNTRPETYGEIYSRNEYIFSIDPEGCVDRDDALSIKSLDDNTCQISVYIANVWLWLDILDLWDHIGTRVSTIYFPDMKRPMIPTVIGEQLCSLDESKRRFGFVIDFIVKKKENQWEISTEYFPTLRQCLICVSKNYVYEEQSLLKDEQYLLLADITKTLDTQVSDSHDVVAYWMTQMNYFVAQMLKQKHIGVFRTVQSKLSNPSHIDNNNDLPMFVKMLEQQMSGSYCMFEQDKDYSHKTLGFSEYVHFTSPIRRMVDLINQMSWILFVIKPIHIRKEVLTFYDRMVSNIEYINDQMKKIRRVQSECEILHKTINEPELMEKVYDGIIVSSTETKSTLYIEDLKWLTYIPFQDNHNKFSHIQCKLYIFEKEEQMKKKIRVQVCDPSSCK